MNQKKEIYSNIIAWYDFKKNSKVLTIYKDDYLCDFFKKKFDKNLTCICIEEKDNFINLNNANIGNDYDYIIMIGSYEYTPKFFISDNPYSDLLKFLKRYLNEDGKIIFTINNKFGIKYFAGAKSSHYNDIFRGLIDNVDYKKSNLLSKNNIISILEEAEIFNYKFYYPVPNYSNVNSIFSDDFLPNETSSKLAYQISYNKGSIVVYNEIEALKQICNSNLFDQFCNSYLLEISNKKIDNDVKFVSFNNLRKDKYSFMLVMHKDKVYKYPILSEDLEHINNIKNNIEDLKKLGFNVIDEVENDVIISKFVAYEGLDKKISQLFKSDKLEDAYESIENWYNYIKDRLLVYNQENVTKYNIFSEFNINISEEMLREMKIVKKGFVDLSFENVFIDEKNQYIFYDQEWLLENVPLEFILYRAIINLYCYNGNIISRHIECDDMLKKFNIFKYKEIFSILEEKFQKQIIDEKKRTDYLNNLPEIKSLSELKEKSDNEVILRECNLKLNEDFQKLNQVVQNINQENQNLITSNQNLTEENRNLTEENQNLITSAQNLTEENQKQNEEIKMLKENSDDILREYRELKSKYSAIVNSKSYKIIKKIKKIIKRRK